MPWLELGAFVLIVAVVMGLRLIGARRLRSGDRRALWLIYLPTIALFAIPLVVVAPSLMGTAPLLGIGLAAGSALILFVAGRGIWRESRSARPIGTEDEFVDAAMAPVTDTVVVATVVMLLTATVGGIALVVWAILQRSS